MSLFVQSPWKWRRRPASRQQRVVPHPAFAPSKLLRQQLGSNTASLDANQLCDGLLATWFAVLLRLSATRKHLRGAKSSTALAAYGPEASDSAEHPMAFCPPPLPPMLEDYDPYSDWDYPDLDVWSTRLDVAGYNTLIAGSDWEGALRLLGEMRSEAVNPDVASYNYALQACRRAAKGQEANQLIEEMWKKGLDPDMASYGAAISACRRAEDYERAAGLLEELRQWGPAPQVERFHTTPKLDWNRVLRQAGCGLRNVLSWNGRGALPRPPAGAAGCWLLPSQEDSALAIAELQAELRAVGWKVLSSAPGVIARLGNKASFREMARELGLEAMLPVHFDDRETARYPCVLKPSVGTWGKDTHIVRSVEDTRRIAPTNFGTRWVLQELIPGRLEYSTSLLCKGGEVFDAVCMRYEYDQEEYIWPHVKDVRCDYCGVPAAHMEVMRAFLEGYSGICNFNYKLRKDGSLCLFEVNPRVGGDLAFEVPRPRACAFFEKMDALFG